MACLRIAVVSTALLTLASHGVSAQTVEVQLSAGLYQPLTDQAHYTDPTTGQSSSYHPGSALAMAGRVTAWLSPVFGIELSGVRASPTRGSSPSAIIMVAFDAVRRFHLGALTEVRLAGGAARIRVSGISYDTASVRLRTTTGGIKVAASVVRAIRPRLSVALGIDDWIYQLDEVRLAPSLVPSGTQVIRQHDIVISFGLAATF